MQKKDNAIYAEWNDDIYAEWHDFLKTIRDGFKNGELKANKELSDYEIAIQYVVGIAHEHNYTNLTAEMIWHLLMAFTDVEIEE